MLVWIFGISTPSKPLQKQSIQALLLSPLSGAFGYSADLHPLTVYKLWASVITRISDSGTQPGLLFVCFIISLRCSPKQAHNSAPRETHFIRKPTFVVLSQQHITFFFTFIVENFMKTPDDAVTYRDWSWIRWLNWPGWMWSSGFWDRFLQMRKHSRPFYATVTRNNIVYLQTAAQLLTESAMRVNHWIYWLEVPLSSYWTDPCKSKEDKLTNSSQTRTPLFPCTHSFTPMLHLHLQVSHHPQRLEGVLWQTLDEVGSQWPRRQQRWEERGT